MKRIILTIVALSVVNCQSATTRSIHNSQRSSKRREPKASPSIRRPNIGIFQPLPPTKNFPPTIGITQVRVYQGNPNFNSFYPSFTDENIAIGWIQPRSSVYRVGKLNDKRVLDIHKNEFRDKFVRHRINKHFYLLGSLKTNRITLVNLQYHENEQIHDKYLGQFIQIPNLEIDSKNKYFQPQITLHPENPQRKRGIKRKLETKSIGANLTNSNNNQNSSSNVISHVSKKRKLNNTKGLNTQFSTPKSSNTQTKIPKKLVIENIISPNISGNIPPKPPRIDLLKKIPKMTQKEYERKQRKKKESQKNKSSKSNLSNKNTNITITVPPPPRPIGKLYVPPLDIWIDPKTGVVYQQGYGNPITLDAKPLTIHDMKPIDTPNVNIQFHSTQIKRRPQE